MVPPSTTEFGPIAIRQSEVENDERIFVDPNRILGRGNRAHDINGVPLVDQRPPEHACQGAVVFNNEQAHRTMFADQT